MDKWIWIALHVTALSAAVPSSAFAFSYTCENMNSWSGCDASCSKNTGLSYTDDQISMFIDEMGGGAHTRVYWYGDSDVWASDITEDALQGGQDHVEIDPYWLHIYSGHGAAYPAKLDRRLFYQQPRCKANGAASCNADSRNTYLGEHFGGYATAHAGNMRWLILCTCYSVDTAPDQQWGNMLYYGSDMVIGYRGTSADSENTDEVPSDFADESFLMSNYLKTGWFYAVEDFWIDDTGSLIASGKSATDADTRRDTINQYTPQRVSAAHTWTSWSWHEG